MKFHADELLLAVIVAGTATFYNPGIMDRVYRNRLAWGQVAPCAECVGMVALLEPERIGERVWLSFDGGVTQIGPLLVVDCAAAQHRADLERRGWAVDVDWQTWERLKLPRMPVPVQVTIVENASGSQ
jgi:hypothetical protein